MRSILLFLGVYVLAWCIYVSRGPIRSRIQNCILANATVLLLLGFLELPVIFGFVDYRSVILPPVARIKPWEDSRYQLDSELLWIRRPHQRFVGEASGDLVDWLGISTDRKYPFDLRYDSHGFRNDHEIIEAPVVVIGDSIVEWGFIPTEELVSNRLGRRFQVEVANLGQPAYGPQQELIVLRRYGLSLRPKIVLWFFFEGNDLLDVRRYESFRRNWDATTKELHSFKRRSFIMNALPVFEGAASALQHRDDGAEARRRSCIFLKSQTEAERTIYFAYEGVPLSGKDEASLDTAQKVFLKAHKLSTDAGIKFLFIYIPTKFRVYQDFCKFPEDGYGKKWQLNNLPSRLETWHKNQGISYLDLTGALKAAAAHGELVYFSDDGHLNARGHEVAADAIVHFIREHGWL